MQRKKREGGVKGASPKRKYVLSHAGMASLQSTIRRNQPWRRSSGPRTAIGKARASRNALRHGERSAETIEHLRLIRLILRLVEQSTATGRGDHHGSAAPASELVRR